MSEILSVRRTVGLMSGTSRDGIDAALLETDGDTQVAPGAWLILPYERAFRRRLADAVKLARRDGRAAAPELAELEGELTDRHAEAVERLLREAGLSAGEIDLIGFHGQTLLHRPEAGLTWQLGDPARLARRLGVPVVGDFRSTDIAAGGQGAPIAPVYHRARFLGSAASSPAAVLNLGGVANVTWADLTGSFESDILAFDCGPGNALIDDWVAASTGESFDADGRLARAGAVDEAVLARLLENPFFAAKPPKSLDRDAFSPKAVEGLSAEDGAATLTAFTAAAVAAGEVHFPAPAKAWYVAGGGGQNPALMAALQARLAAPVGPVKALGWRGEALEAELMAYLAVRCLARLPATFPGTTGVSAPLPAGRVFEP